MALKEEKSGDSFRNDAATDGGAVSLEGSEARFFSSNLRVVVFSNSP